jgi:hypothetical protein
MDYFAGLDISMDETHICVLDREGAASLRRWQSRSQTSYQRPRVAVGSYSRPGEWRRSCSTG